jgi:biopolymer transport protein ExbD
MAPLIDIIFLLLIFFLVAAKWRPEEDFLPLKFSTVTSADSALAKPEPLIVYINATPTGCDIRFAAEKITIENATITSGLAILTERLNNCLGEQKRLAADPVEIVCSEKVRSDHWIKIYNLFYGMGLTDITFAMTE